MSERSRDEARQGWMLRVFDLFGNPLEWSYASRALLIISTTIFFQVLFVVETRNRTAPLEITRDLDAVRWFIDWGRHLPWYPLLLMSFWLRKHKPDARWFLWLTCIYWYFTIAVSGWFYAPIDAALWISMVGVTLVLMVIVEWWVVGAGLVLFFVLYEAGPVLSLYGYETYAPFYSAARSMTPALQVNWWNELYLMVLMLTMVIVFAYMIDRWRLREQGLAEANIELTRLAAALEASQGQLEHRVEERTEELRQTNRELQEEVAKRQVIEAALRFTEYSVEHAADSVFWIGENGKITSVNAQACKALGYAREELVGSTVDMFSPRWDGLNWENLWKRMEEYGSLTFQTIHRRKDGSEFPVEIKQSFLTFDETPYLCAFVRDLTERKQVEEDRLRLERKLLESQKLESLGVLAGGIAHDFNNMLMTILGNASLTLLDLPAGSPSCEHVRAVETAARRAADLTQQLLAYSGRSAVLQDAVSLNELTREMADLLQVSIGKSVHLEFQFDSKLPAVHADATQIRQVVMNLIVNASEAIGEERGDIVLRTSREHLDADDLARLRVGQGLDEGDYVRLEVRDTGSGMDKATLDRLFDPFFTTKFAGRGLGLAATLGIVKSHRGGLQVSTQKGGGACFEVYLPVFPEKEVRVGARGREAKPASEVPEGESPRGPVAVIDDETDVRNATRELLARLGYEVLLFESGAKLVQYLRDHRREPLPVFALLDMTMPDWSGPETFKALLNECPDLPVILMSGYAEEDTLSQFGAHRPAGFLQKPFGMEQLSDAIARWIEPGASSSAT